MTETEWLACTDPKPMLEFQRGKASDRKLRLFAVACCRRICDLIKDEPFRHAVQTAELCADGGASFDELEAAFFASDRALSNQLQDGGLPAKLAADATRLAAHPDMRGLADGTAAAAAMARAFCGGDFWERDATEQSQQCHILRDIFGNPFHPVTVDPLWLIPTVTTLARIIYDERTFDQLPDLADALEAAGCTNEEILAHCRTAEEHVRGCWVLDLLLGRS